MSGYGPRLTFGKARNNMGHVLALVPAVLLAGLALGACGGPAMESGNNPTDTATAWINGLEAEDPAHVEQLLTPEARQAIQLFAGGLVKHLNELHDKQGTPLKGKGKVLQVKESGSTATADVAVVYDNKCTKCTPASFVPDWAPADSYVDATKLSMQKDANEKWIIGNWEDSAYYSDRIEGTRVAVAGATGTAVKIIYEATQAAIPTQTPLPTATATPVIAYVTAKSAYRQGDILSEIKRWSEDAVLFRVYDRDSGDTAWHFDYNETNDEQGQPYSEGDGTSRQWLFFVMSPGKKEVKVWRVLDGKLDRADVSAATYRDLFAASGEVPTPINMDEVIDSDQAMKTAREHGYSADNLRQVLVQLDAGTKKPSDPKSGETVWTIYRFDNAFFGGKVIKLNPLNGDIVKNDF